VFKLYWFFLCFLLSNNLFSASLPKSGQHKIFEKNIELADGDVVKGLATFQDGFSLQKDSCCLIRGNVAGKIDLGSTGTLSLNGDLHCSSATSLKHGGIVNGNGNTIFLSSDFSIPKNESVIIAGDVTIDGRGSSLFLQGKLIINDGVKFTLKNIYLRGQNIDLLPDLSCLSLENVTWCLDDNYNFQNGFLEINKDIFIKGDQKNFIYSSNRFLNVNKFSSLKIDSGITFMYDPSDVTDENIRNLILMKDATSVLLFDNSSIVLPRSGLQLTKGTLIFDNNVSIKNQGIKCNKDSFEWGDGTLHGGLNVEIRSAACIELDGCVYNHSLDS
jgi:hypothetical protein